MIQPTKSAEASPGYQVDPDLVQGALIGPAIGPATGPAACPATDPAKDRVLLFAGHMIDKPKRAEPRFPAAQEATARRAIRAAVAREQARWPAGTRALGIAGGANGGDILFHEVCSQLGITTALYLAMPPADYLSASVQVDPAIDSQPGWVERFHRIHQRCESAGACHQLSDGSTPPDDAVWERNNQWMLQSALACGADKLTLLVLWDGLGGDAPGGTQHMVDVAAAAGAAVVHLNSRVLFGLDPAPA